MSGLGWIVALVAGASGAETLSLDQAVREAIERAPAVQEAVRTLEASDAGVILAHGGFDPQLSVDGGWNRSLSRQRFGQFPDPFRITSDGWDAGMTLSGMAPTGTSATFDMRMRQSTATVSLDGEDNSVLDQLFGSDQEQKTFQPSFSFSLSQELLKGIRLKSGLAQVRQAKEARTLSALQLDQARQQAIADTSRLYWTWVYRDQVARIERQGVATAEEALRVGQARVDAGRAAPVERTRLQAALVQATVEAITAENEAARARDDLLVTLGRPPGQEVDPSSVPGDVPAVALDLAQATAEARTGSLDVLVALAQVDQARSALADAKHAMLPQLTASLNGSLQGFDDTSWADSFVWLETMLPSVGVRGTLNVPLGNRAATGDKRRAAAELERAEVSAQRVVDQVSVSVAAQVRTLRTARTQVELADANLRLSEETLSAEQARYDAGRALLQDVLEAREQVERTAAEAVRARTDFRVAEVELKRLQGRLVDGL